MWRSLLLHEMPDGDLRNFNAVAGSVSPGSFQLNPDAIAPGQEFAFALESPLDEVIGTSCRLRLRKPISSFSVFRIMRAGTDLEFSVQRLNTPPIDTPVLAAEYHGLLRIGPNPAVPLGVLVLPHRAYVDLRIDWHTSGQAWLWQDGRLVGYHNALAPGASILIPALAFGRSDVPPGPGSRYGVARFFVRALRRSDASDVLARLIPQVPVEEDPRLARCLELARADLLAFADALRPFMSLAHQQLSTTWSLDSGDPQGPFSREATEAHRLALEAAAALVQILRRNDFTHPEAFLEPFEAFLRTLHDALPTEFEALAQDLLSTEMQLGQDCIRRLNRDRIERGAAMEPVLELFEEAAAIVEQVASTQ